MLWWGGLHGHHSPSVEASFPTVIRDLPTHAALQSWMLKTDHSQEHAAFLMSRLVHKSQMLKIIDNLIIKNTTGWLEWLRHSTRIWLLTISFLCNQLDLNSLRVNKMSNHFVGSSQ